MNTKPLLASFLAIATLVGTNPPAFAVSDDFNDGDDAGWDRYDPLVAVGASASGFTFPNGGYRLEASVSPNEGAFGPGRAASFRPDGVFSLFHVEVDVVNWEATLEQAFGSLARISSIGLGSTDGYGLIYTTGSTNFQLGRIDDENFTTLASVGLTLSPASDYRFIFDGTDENLTGFLYDLADLSTPLATLNATDFAYASGVTGVLVAADGNPGTADATFDNFSAVPEPSAAALLIAGIVLANRRRPR